jgi:hypothetical protein
MKAGIRLSSLFSPEKTGNGVILTRFLYNKLSPKHTFIARELLSFSMAAKKSPYRRAAKAAESHNQHRTKYPDIVMKVITDSDIILEVLEARFWKETRNTELEKEIKRQGKKIIYVLNKSDLADRKKIIKEMGENLLYPYIFVSSRLRRGHSELMQRIKIEAKNFGKEKVYVGVIGYPNTGKSSVVNLIRGSPVARVASEAGFTKGIQKIKIAEKIYLIDTPGVIPSLEDSNISGKDLFKHAKINVRRWDKIKDPESIVHSLVQEYPGVFERFYKIRAKGDSEILLEELGRRKGFLVKGNEVDKDRTSRAILRDFQEGRIRI